MGKRQEAALETRKKIIETMKQLLQEKGAEHINIEEITTRAGIAKGSFYTHFKRKEDVVSVIALEQYDIIRQNALKLSGGIYEKLCDYLRLSICAIHENTLQIAQNWMKSVAAPIEGERGGIDKYCFDYSSIKEMLEEAVHRGELKDDTLAEMLTKQILHSYYGAVICWCITNGEDSLTESMEDFCRYELKEMLEKFQ